MAILLEHYDHSQLVEAAGEYHPYSFLLNAAEVAPGAYGHAMNERGVSDSTVYELLEAKFGKMTEFSAPVFTYESYQDSFYATSNKPYHVRTLGDKRYELTNHLGNVLTLVSDRKIAVEDQGNPGTVEYYEADVVSAQDYYPFGMIQPGRSVSAGEYRYGFGGQEMDNEISGTGNSYTAEFWQYDPRLGRRWNVDPVDKPFLSSYTTFSNNPILRIDPDGDNDYFSQETGEFLGDDGTGGDEMRLIDAENYELYNDAPFEVDDLGEKLETFSNPIDSDIDDHVLENVVGHYWGEIGFSPNELERLNTDLPDNIVANIDLTNGGSFELGLNKNYLGEGEGIEKLYDMKNLLVHERGGHGSDLLEGKEHSWEREIFWGWEERATRLQVQDETWTSTSDEFQYLIYRNYGKHVFTNEEQRQYFRNFPLVPDNR